MSDMINENQPIAPAPPEPEAPAEDAWTGPSQEEWQAAQERLQQLEPLAESWQAVQQQQQPDPYQQQPQQNVQLPDGTLLSEQDVEFLTQHMRQQWLQDVAPVYDYTEQQQYAETKERAADMIVDYAASQGFELKDKETAMIQRQALDYVPELLQQYGQSPKVDEVAVQRAFEDYKAVMDERAKAYHEQQVNQLGTLGNAPMQPTPTAPAAQNLAAPTGGPRAVVQKYFPGS
jgi:hypothetical protein